MGRSNTVTSGEGSQTVPARRAPGHGVAWHCPRSESAGMGQALPGSPHLPEPAARDYSPLPISHRCPFREGQAARQKTHGPGSADRRYTEAVGGRGGVGTQQGVYDQRLITLFAPMISWQPARFMSHRELNVTGIRQPPNAPFYEVLPQVNEQT